MVDEAARARLIAAVQARRSSRPVQVRALPVRPRSIAPTRMGGVAPLVIGPRPQDTDTDRSLFEQIRDAATGVVPGLFKLGGMVLREATGTPRMAVDALRGDTDAQYRLLTGQYDPMRRSGVTYGEAFAAKKAMDDGAVVDSRYSPLTASMGLSFANTADRVANPTEYQQAIRDGRIVDVLLEDVGNLSLVAGPVGKGLSAAGAARGSAGLTRAGTTVQRAAALGGEIADAPISIPRRAVQAADRRIVGGLARAANNPANPRVQAVATRARNSAPFLLTPEGRTVWRDAIRVGNRRANKATGQVVEKFARIDQLIGHDPIAASVALSLRPGLIDAANLLQNDLGLDPETARQAHVLKDFPEETLSAETIAAGQAYRDGTMDPELRERVDMVLAAMDEVLDPITQEMLAGDSTITDLNPQQLRDDAVDAYVARSLMDDHGWSQRDIDTLMEMRQEFDSWDQFERETDGLVPELSQVLDDPMVYPARWRGPLRTMRMGNEFMRREGTPDPKMMAEGARLQLSRVEYRRARELADQAGGWHNIPELVARLGDQATDVDRMIGSMVTDMVADPAFYRSMEQGLQFGERLRTGRTLPIRPSGLLARGLPSPQYVPGGRVDIARPKIMRIESEPVNLGTWGLQTTSAEQLRSASEFSPQSLRGLTEKVSSTVGKMERNRALLDVIQDPTRLPRVSNLLDETTLADIRARADQQANATVRGTTRDLNRERTRLEAEAIEAALNEQGWSVWWGDPDMPASGQFNPLDPIDFESGITDNMVVLPVGVKKKLEQRLVSKDAIMPLQVLRWINRKFKGAVLPFSIRWQVGDMVGIGFMGWTGGGVLPSEIVSNIRRLGDLSDDAVNNVLLNRDFVDSSLTFPERERFLRQNEAPTPRTPIGRVQNRSYGLNTAINRYGRQGYLMAKLDRVLQKQGLSIDAIENNPDAPGWDAPEVQAAINEAVSNANQVLGTFDELTPFEDRWLKGVFPFYAWMRHITKLTTKIAIDNPARIMWTLRLGSLGVNPDEELPDWLKGAITVPDALMPDFLVEGDAKVNLNFLNPFADSIGNPPTTAGYFTRSMSPGLKVAAAGLNVDLNKGLGEPITRRYGSERNPLTDMLYQGMSAFPLSREALNVAPTGEFANIGLGPHPRYRSGQQILNDAGQPIDTYSRWLSGLSLVGLPRPIALDTAEAMAPGVQRSADSPSERGRRTRRRRTRSN